MYLHVVGVGLYLGIARIIRWFWWFWWGSVLDSTSVEAIRKRYLGLFIDVYRDFTSAVRTSHMGRVRTKLNMVINIVIVTLIITLIIVVVVVVLVTERPSSRIAPATSLVLTTRPIGATLVVVVLSRGVVTVFKARFSAET